MGAPEEHRAHGPASVAVAVVTVSDTRTEGTDESGRLLKDRLSQAGHKVVRYEIVKDEAPGIWGAVERGIDAADAVITNGGTGVSPRDVTIETLEPRFEKVLPGFGELFRTLSYREVGSAAMLSRATAGVLRGKLVFCLPGSPDAVALGVEDLILPELGHAVGVVRH